MDLNWANLRILNGAQSDGFEELCSQLARVEVPDDAEFIRKGSPDGGVECYCRLENSEEWGWQAKFFREPLGDSQWRQLDESVKTALKAHPNLVRYFVCVPRNPADGGSPENTTELRRWKTRVAKWEGWASDHGMAVEFEWWGTSELALRLSQESQAGRFRFWFGPAGQFSSEWFGKNFKRAVVAAGPRYTPKVHVDVPLLEDLESFGRSDIPCSAVRNVAKNIRQTPTYHLRRLADEEATMEITALQGVGQSVDNVVESLYGMRCQPNEKWPLSEVIEGIQNARKLLQECEAPLSAAAEEFTQPAKAEESSPAHRFNPYSEAAYQVRALERVLWNALDTLWSLDQVVNCDLMIVTGEAGSGKTHLLCDIAKRRLAGGSPTVILMGQQFTTRESPWIQGRAQLDLGDLSLEEFVGALEAAAQAADCRALLMIDAINEGEGSAIWWPHLASFLTHLQASPWIGVVLSVRTPYMEYVVPDEVRESAHEVAHQGFADDTYAAVERFCEFYGLDFPATPLLRPEFDNPLFLKTLCEGLQHSAISRIPVGAEGIDAVFNRYVGKVEAELAKRLDFDPQDQIVTGALDAVAMEIVEQGTRWLPKKRVQELVDPLAPSSGYSRTLYRSLVEVGLLMELPNSRSDNDWIVYFGYEWFADYRIANCLIAQYGDARSLASAVVRADTSSGIAGWTPWSSLLDAFSVLMPERLGVELPAVLADQRTGRRIRYAFLRGLPWRDPAKIGPSCLGLVEELLATAQLSETVEEFDALVTCSMVPGHPLGSAFIDNWLRQLNMPDRDAIWSKYLFLTYGEGGPVDRLLDWAERQSRQSAALDDETAAACATVLAWFLTSSHRFVRDRATKCLVALLTDRIELVCDLVRQFDDVDDLYVRERVMAAAYGVSMRSNDGQALAPLADLVYLLVFANGEPPVHILLRDYARGVIERAQHLGAEITVDANLVDPPYRSEWRRIPDDSEVESFNPRKKDHQSELTVGELAQSEIYSSVMTWDFARYVIGTNSTLESGDWLSIPNAKPPWQSEEELADDFKDSLPPDLRSAFEELWTNTRSVQRRISFVSAEMEEKPCDEDESEVMFTGYERYIDPRQEERLIARLSDEQEAAYHVLKAARGSSPPRLSLDIIQRYVLWRVFDLGWTVERFGVLDRDISGSSIGSSGFRASQKPERIGKKYQWIAYHEIMGYISDRYQYRAMYEDTEPNNAYRGTWQLSVRDIDPSAVDTGAPQSQGRIEESGLWWRHEVAIAEFDDVSNEQWLRDDSDIPSRDQQLRFTNRKDGDTWIKILGLDTWRTPAVPGFDEFEVERREIWLMRCGYLIDASEVEEFIEWSRKVEFSPQWMPQPPKFLSLFFGEFGWSFASNAQLAEYLEIQCPVPRQGPRCPVGLRPLTLEYHSEVGDHDCSVAEGYRFYRPIQALIEALDLRWTGHGADFVDPGGRLEVFDPSADGKSSSALLVREESLQRFLDDTASALVWALPGEKRVLAPLHSQNVWAGSLHLSGAAAYSPDALEGFLSKRLELPNSGS